MEGTSTCPQRDRGYMEMDREPDRDGNTQRVEAAGRWINACKHTLKRYTLQAKTDNWTTSEVYSETCDDSVIELCSDVL